MSLRAIKSDEQLLEQYQQTGDLTVFSTLFVRYKPLLIGVAAKYVGSSNAEDVVMDVFETSNQSLLGSNVQNFRSWIYVVVKNACLMKLRAQKKAQFDEIDESRMELSVAWHPMIEDMREEELKRLELCMESLSSEQRASINGFYTKRKSYDMLAKELNVSLKKVKSLLQNGRRNLKLCMESK